MPKLLELFSGTGSIGQAFRRIGWEVVSLDITPMIKPTTCTNILDWEYTAFPKDSFQFIWGSPLCTFYSIARTTRVSTVAELSFADSLVQRTLEIINYFGCPWAFENPQTGKLKDRPFMQELGLPFKDVTYCKYGYSYKKRTRIWNSLGAAWQPNRICDRWSRCCHFANGCHPSTAQRGPCHKKGLTIPEGCHTQDQLYSIPTALCDEMAHAAHKINLARNVLDEAPSQSTSSQFES